MMPKKLTFWVCLIALLLSSTGCLRSTSLWLNWGSSGKNSDSGDGSDNDNDNDNNTNTTSSRGFVNIGPGGGGAFTGIAIHPTNSNIFFTGTNVGGIIRTTDGGKTFENVTNGIMTRYIGDMRFATVNGTIYLLVATPMGLYVSDNSNGNKKIGDSWSLKTSGLEDGYGHFDFYHPILSLAVDPSNNDTVWIGIGHPRSSDTRGVVTFETGDERCDPYSIYKYSITSGTFSPKLSLTPSVIGMTRGTSMKTACDAIAAAETTITGPAVLSITVHPSDSKTVMFATDVGLYTTYDGGDTFYEVGVTSPQFTTDKGVTLTSVSSSTITIATRESVSLTSSSCSTGFTSACLPIETDMSETHPLIRGTDIVVVDGKTRLYAVILDTGFIPRSSDGSTLCSTTDKSADDSSFTNFHGGPWYSDDLGKTWTYYYTAKDNPSSTIGSRIRCDNEEDNPQHSTSYSQIKVDPSDKDHIFMSVFRGSGGTGGIWEQRIFSGSTYEWKSITSAHPGSSTVPTGLCYEEAPESGLNITYDSCYEGNRPDDLFRDGTGIASGTLSLFTVTNWDTSATELFFSTQRGLAKATWKAASSWSDGKARYYIDHVHTDPVSSSGVMEYWTSSELNDYCPEGGLSFLDSSGTKLALTGADSGILLSSDSGASWKLVRDNVNYEPYASEMLMPTDFKLDDVGYTIHDEDNNILYAYTSDANNSDKSNSVIMSTDGGELWQVVGGYCSSSSSGACETDDDGLADNNGLPNEDTIYSMALDYSRSTSRRVLVGTKEDGAYFYDPLSTATDQWTAINGSGCPVPDSTSAITVTVNGFWSSPDRSGVILAAVDSSESSLDGIYQITLGDATSSCKKLVGDSEGTSELKNPYRVTLAKNGDTLYLIAAGQLHGYPILFRTPITISSSTIETTNIDWDIKLDFNYNYSGGPSAAASTWDSYLDNHSDWRAEYEHEYFDKKDFGVLITVPGNANIILAALTVPVISDYNVSAHIYISKDAGNTWEVAEDFENLPVKSMEHIQFSPDKKKIYFSTKCSSVFVACSPFEENNNCSLP